MAKAVFDVPSTAILAEWLAADAKRRWLFGAAARGAMAIVASFSQAFAEPAGRDAQSRVHEASIRPTLGTALVGHVARHVTAARRARRQNTGLNRKPTIERANSGGR